MFSHKASNYWESRFIVGKSCSLLAWLALHLSSSFSNIKQMKGTNWFRIKVWVLNRSRLQGCEKIRSLLCFTTCLIIKQRFCFWLVEPTANTSSCVYQTHHNQKCSFTCERNFDLFYIGIVHLYCFFPVHYSWFPDTGHALTLSPSVSVVDDIIELFASTQLLPAASYDVPSIQVSEYIGVIIPTSLCSGQVSQKLVHISYDKAISLSSPIN